MPLSIIYHQYIDYSYTVARNPGTKADPKADPTLFLAFLRRYSRPYSSE